jgi:hypothetical protein
MATKAGPGSATAHTRPAAASAAVRWGAWAGIVYVLTWLAGLFLAPSAPDPFGSAGTINAYFSGHRSAAMIQSVFVHGLAGVALLGLTAALWSYLAAGDTAGPRRVMLAAGVLAAVVSFLQVAFMIGIYVHVGQHGSADGTRALFNAINKADTVKLWTEPTATEPSPTAPATRLTEPYRMSPAANTPGRLVSNGSGGRDSGHASGGMSWPVRMKP